MNPPPSRPDPRAALRQRALGLLARREHARRELVRKLHGEDATEVAALLDDLAAAGLQSDVRFAEQFVASRITRGHGPVRIRNDLRERGIDAALADEAMDAAEVDWDRLLDRVRTKRFGDAPPADRREQARQARFLAQRGFTAEAIRKRLTAND